jgi:hypothetical protein
MSGPNTSHSLITQTVQNEAHTDYLYEGTSVKSGVVNASGFVDSTSRVARPDCKKSQSNDLLQIVSQQTQFALSPPHKQNETRCII